MRRLEHLGVLIVAVDFFVRDQVLKNAHPFAVAPWPRRPDLANTWAGGVVKRWVFSEAATV